MLQLVRLAESMKRPWIPAEGSPIPEQSAHLLLGGITERFERVMSRPSGGQNFRLDPITPVSRSAATVGYGDNFETA
jgi:hypothetical protein